jgi:hypothetical protein
MSISALLRTWAGQHGTGYVAEAEARPLPDFERLGLPSASSLGDAFSDADLAQYLPNYFPLNQGATGSCVAQFWATAEVLTMAARHGVASPLPSRRFAYYWAQYLDGGRVDDSGCRPSMLLRAVTEKGLPTEARFPWSVARINQQPPASARWDARDHVGKRGSYQLYYSRLDERVEALCAAVSSGRAFGLSIPVGEPFDACRSAATIEWPYAGKIRGQHMVTGLGVRRDGAVHVINSWGPQWGASGQGWLSPEYLARSSSIIVVDPQQAVQ